MKHNRLRRKEGHDYSAACIYLITVTTAGRQRNLGTLMGCSPDEAHIKPTALGEYVIAAFRKMAAMVTDKTGSSVQVLQYQLMPDHFHGILYIREALPQGWNLGRMIGAWKGDCSREYWRNIGLTPDALNKESEKTNKESDATNKESEKTNKESDCSTPHEPNKEGSSPISLSSAPSVSSKKSPLFAAGFNDKILFHEGQLQTWYDYLHDNPRRLWLKAHFPDRLKKTYDFRAGEQGHSYTAVGNTFLVTYPERVQVRCHRNLSPEEIQAQVACYMRMARSGAVLVSPFISPAEKAVYDAAYQERLPLIHIVNRGLNGRFIYPTGRDLAGCSAGFLLVLAPYADYSTETAEKRITRSQCLDLNNYAADLATVALTPEYPDKKQEDL